MSVHWLLERMGEQPNNAALVWHDQSFTYGWLLDMVSQWHEQLAKHRIETSHVVAIDADFSPRVCALLLALIENKNLIVPLTPAVGPQKSEFLDTAEVEAIFAFNEDDRWQLSKRPAVVSHPLMRGLIQGSAPGLILFSSGSTGKSKAALHDFNELLEKFRTRRHCYVTLSFLLLDHIGGINTLFYTLSNCGTVVSVISRNPADVCRSIEKHRVQLLPTTPTFLNLLLISEQYKEFDLSSLELITYGTEVMPESTLRRLHEIFPNTRLLQTYGLSELGILRSKSKSSESLWVKVGGEGYETKVVDGTLWIRSRSAMLGYLNSPSPFDGEGWFNTGDVVEIDGEYIRILGRQSDIINVGGQKVYPAEVESVLLQMDNIKDAIIHSEKNPIVGNIVVARINLAKPESPVDLKKRIREYCKGRLASFKIPAKVEIASFQQYSARYKRMRKQVRNECS
jgi:long-chain acyl-CoA synthetase